MYVTDIPIFSHMGPLFPSVLLHCWLGDRKGIRSVKKLGVGLLVVMI